MKRSNSDPIVIRDGRGEERKDYENQWQSSINTAQKKPVADDWNVKSPAGM